MGGIVAMTEKQMTALNGYSNMFFVWGGEDDNLYDRYFILRSMMIIRVSSDVKLIFKANDVGHNSYYVN